MIRVTNYERAYVSQRDYKVCIGMKLAAEEFMYLP